MQRESSSPEAYLEEIPAKQRRLLETIRDVIFEINPDQEEIMEYGMLGYPGLANLGAQK